MCKLFSMAGPDHHEKCESHCSIVPSKQYFVPIGSNVSIQVSNYEMDKSNQGAVAYGDYFFPK